MFLGKNNWDFIDEILNIIKVTNINLETKKNSATIKLINIVESIIIANEKSVFEKYLKCLLA